MLTFLLVFVPLGAGIARPIEAAAGASQATVAQESRATTAEVRQLMTLMGARQLAAQLEEGVLSHHRRTHPEVPEEVWVAIKQDLPDVVMEAAIPIYQKYLGAADIKGLIAFFESPLGGKLVRVQPAIRQELQAGDQLRQEIAKRVRMRLKERGYATSGEGGPARSHGELTPQQQGRVDVSHQALKPDPARLQAMGLDANDVEAPVAVATPGPAYPESALQARIQGTVSLRCTIEADGGVDRCQITESLTPECDAAAVAAAQNWRYNPTRVKGKNVPAQVAIKVHYQLPETSLKP